MFNRRNFLKAGAATLPLAAAIEALHPNVACSVETIADIAAGGAAPKLIPLPTRLAPIDPATLPWQQNIRRVGQSNMTEHDPAVMNIDEWADFWHSANTDILFVSVTGILAFYPSKVKFHRHGKFLNGRDFFGECVAAAKKRGMRCVARMSADPTGVMRSRPIRNGPCAMQTAPYSSVLKIRDCSRPVCSPPTWMITCRPS